MLESIKNEIAPFIASGPKIYIFPIIPKPINTNNTTARPFWGFHRRHSVFVKQDIGSRIANKSGANLLAEDKSKSSYFDVKA